MVGSGRRRPLRAGILACGLAAALVLPGAAAAAGPRDALAAPPHVSVLPARVERARQRMETRRAHVRAQLAAMAGPDAKWRPEVIRVTTLEDVAAVDGACSLREAIAYINLIEFSWEPVTDPDCAPDGTWTELIRFKVGGTLTLTANLPSVSGWISIDAGNAPSRVTIDGGGAYRPFTVNSQGMLDLYSLTLAHGATDAAGGAIANRGFLTSSDLVVADSAAALGGGGVNGSTGSLTWLQSTTITGNRTDGYGGGLRSAGMTLVFNSTVTDNSAGLGGGGVMAVGNEDWPFVAENSTIADNTVDAADGVGGGLYNAGFSGLLNATVAGNSAAGGGGIRDIGTLEAYNITIAGNEADTGSGISSTATPLLVNSIVLDNAGSDPQIDSPLDDDATHDLLELPLGVTLDQVLDPAGLADNGGPTPTIALVRDAANPAWGTGDDTQCLDLGLVFDQRMYERSAPCDLGAYEIDDLAPVQATPDAWLVAGDRLAGDALSGFADWPAQDLGSGVATTDVELAIDDGAYVPIAVDPSLPALPFAFAPGTRYQLRARSTDADGNQSAWETGPAFTARLVQQSAGSVDYSAGWKTDGSSANSGGSAKYATRSGAWVKFTATGRAFAFVSTTGASRGKAKIYVDGRLVRTIDLGAKATTHRVQVWTREFATAGRHTIKIVVVGTGGRPRVDVDAFGVLE